MSSRSGDPAVSASRSVPRCIAVAVSDAARFATVPSVRNAGSPRVHSLAASGRPPDPLPCSVEAG